MKHCSHDHQQRHDDDNAKSVDKDRLPSIDRLEFIDLIGNDVAFVCSSVIAEEDLRTDGIRIVLNIFLLPLLPELQIDLV